MAFSPRKFINKGKGNIKGKPVGLPLKLNESPGKC